MNALVEPTVILVLLLLPATGNAVGDVVIFTLNTGVPLPVKVSDVNAH